MANQNPNIVWQAPEFRHYEKNVGWYISAAAIAVLIVGFFIIESDLFAALSISILAAFVILFSRHRPEIVEIELNYRGVRFANVTFPYKQIKYFWVVHNQDHKTLILQTTAFLNNIIVLELENQDPETVRLFLLQHLPEHEQTEPTLPQRIMHKLKF